MARRVVDGARIGEGIEQVESSTELLLELGLQRMVIGESGAPGNFHFAKSLVRAARVERDVLARVLGAGLVDVAEDHQLVRAVTDVGDVEKQVLGDFALDGEMPAHHVTGASVGGRVAHRNVLEIHARHIDHRGRVSGGGVSEAVGERDIGGAGRGGGKRVVDRRGDDGGRIVGQQIFAAQAIEMDVADSETAADNRLWVEAVGQADAGRPVIAVRADQRALENAAVLGEDGFLRRDVVVGEVVAVFPLRRRVLVADAKVERKFGRDLPVILQIEKVHSLAVLRGEDVGERVGAAGAEQEVGDIVDVVAGRARGSGKLPAVGVSAILGTEVQHVGVDGLKLITQLQ